MKKFRAALFVLFACVLAGPTSAKSARVVIMIGEDQYNTAQTLPEFAAAELKPHAFDVTVIQADAANPNNFPGLEAALQNADLLVVSVRRRTPPKAQLEAIRAYLSAGKPLVGIRTACHAFALRPRDKLADPSLATWQDFDPEVLGGHYDDHHKGGPAVSVVVAPGANANPILQGVSASALTTTGPLYKTSPLKSDTTALLIGSIPDQRAEPLAWTRLYGANRARIFFTSLGTPDDFKNPAFRRLLLNGMQWAAPH